MNPFKNFFSYSVDERGRESSRQGEVVGRVARDSEEELVWKKEMELSRKGKRHGKG